VIRDRSPINLQIAFNAYPTRETFPSQRHGVDEMDWNDLPASHFIAGRLPLKRKWFKQNPVYDNVERFSLAARRTGCPFRDSVAGIRAGERKTCCAKPLPPSPGLWVLNTAASFADTPSGHSGGLLASIDRPKGAFERSSQPGFGSLAPVEHHPWPSLRKRRHPDLAGNSTLRGWSTVPGS
jgi:hypothetical protein